MADGRQQPANQQTVTTQTTETQSVEDPAADPKKEHRMTVAERVIYLIGGIVMGLLAVRFLLLLLGANPANGFANFIYDVSNPFAAPFFGLFNYDTNYGQSTLELASVVAILVYALVVVLLVRLVTIGSRRER